MIINSVDIMKAIEREREFTFTVIIDGNPTGCFYDTEDQAWDGCYEMIGSSEGCVVVKEEV